MGEAYAVGERSAGATRAARAVAAAVGRRARGGAAASPTRSQAHGGFSVVGLLCMDYAKTFQSFSSSLR